MPRGAISRPPSAEDGEQMGGPGARPGAPWHIRRIIERDDRRAQAAADLAEIVSTGAPLEQGLREEAVPAVLARQILGVDMSMMSRRRMVGHTQYRCAARRPHSHCMHVSYRQPRAGHIND